MIIEEIEKRYNEYLKKHRELLNNLPVQYDNFEEKKKELEEVETELFTLYNLKQYIKNQLQKDLENTHY